MKTIQISGKKNTDLSIIVDDIDYLWISKYKWYISNGYPYRTIYVNKKIINITLHREIMKPLLGEVTDHINHNKLDARRENLRNCTSSQNNMNKTSQKDSSSKYLGVGIINIKSKNKIYQYWLSSIGINGKSKHLGTFKNEEDAAKCYDKAALIYNGEFANLNFK